MGGWEGTGPPPSPRSFLGSHTKPTRGAPEQLQVWEGTAGSTELLEARHGHISPQPSQPSPGKEAWHPTAPSLGKGAKWSPAPQPPGAILQPLNTPGGVGKLLRVVPAFSHSLPAAGTRTHTPSPVHKGSLSCSAQPCNVCKRRELPYSHSPNRLLSPSWPGSCSHSCFNPWEQRHDSKQLFAHWSGLPPATSSSFSPPFFLVCWVRIFFFF